ncbi:hypothetical protein CY34DRAFT_813467 [Suillus luteus UH-Slu-Lm8-n1]|uniref:Uncharacterized protein n=1 Tax=Suillus luteus UH-Slu-Lm8-n1 TaxID=930992 RepID=A0A0D0ANT2_9AGAM|nr:hypothetical protein CY34DRAFT_813467 [Suillus luteus UH-Slu-Lm8-n1]
MTLSSMFISMFICDAFGLKKVNVEQSRRADQLHTNNAIVYWVLAKQGSQYP